jgi:glyoxylase-like metal-dependent hydrolase (beta-lactamase superfamily II)
VTASAVHVLDLDHLGHPRVLSVYLVEEPEPTLIDCGTTASVPVLREALGAHGLGIEDLRHLLLTHVHLDHAGATGTLVAENPRLRVHVSALGARHIVDPERLERSARQVFGADFDRVCGAIVPVPAGNVETLGDRAVGFDAFPTPGHAVHHVSFVDGDGSCYVGDVCGIRMPPDPYVVPGTPPPDIDLDAYERSFAAIEARDVERLCLAHFGVAEDPERHIATMRDRLGAWAHAVREGIDEETFVSAGNAELERLHPDDAAAIAATNPYIPSYRGLRHYWSTRKEAPSSGAPGAPSG